MTTQSALVPAVGSVAPEFSLPDQYGREVSLGALRAERGVLVVFYPFAFSGICTGELREIRDELSRFDNARVQVATISCDPVFAQRAWDDAEGFFFPLLSDFWPHGQVASAYGVFDERNGCPRRGTFLIDTEGIVRWTLVNDTGVRRDFTGVDAAVSELPAPRAR